MDSNENEPSRWEQIDSKNFRVFVVGVAAATLINHAMFGTQLAASFVTATCFIGVYAYLRLRYGGGDD